MADIVVVFFTMSTSLVESLAGSLAGVISFISTYPLVTLSARKQVQRSYSLNRLIKEEGVFGLFSGLSSGIFATALTQAIYYYFYATSRSFLERRYSTKQLTTLSFSLCAFFSGFMTALSTNPIWVINSRLQQKAGNSVFKVTSQLLQEDGISGFFKGIGTCKIIVVNSTRKK